MRRPVIGLLSGDIPELYIVLVDLIRQHFTSLHCTALHDSVLPGNHGEYELNDDPERRKSAGLSERYGNGKGGEV